MRIFPTPRYCNEQELLDKSGEATRHELEHTLRDIRRANIFGLGTWVVKHHLSRLLGAGQEQGVSPAGAVSGVCKTAVHLRILDVATGSADIPQALCEWGTSAGLDIEVVATDIS